MSDPIVPNYKKGVGQLVTSRYDFQDHVDGYAFKHNSQTITISPSITIGSVARTNVYDAIVALNNVIAPSFTVPDATTGAKGVVQLAGDIGGTATNVRVTKLQTRNVNSVPPSDGQVLTWVSSNNNWEPATPSTNFTASGDLFGDNTTQTVIKIQGFAVATTTPTSNKALVWNSSTTRWEPTTIMPTGTGFNTTTSGVFDAAATTNMRYTGGKLQVDTVSGVQYKNGSVTGDLAWSPTTSNKTLNLPDTSDTLVARNTTDNLTNKILSADTNTITASGTLAGDVLISNGVKFIRVAKGSENTFLGVNGGVLGYYNPLSLSTPSGTGFAHLTSGVYDSAATLNIRYAGNKLQTDVSVQWKNGSFTGDLSWAPTLSNKFLALPDANDTLVGKSTTDIFTNKTFDVVGSGNSLFSSSQALGDLLKNNGTKFVRFAIGSALQVLRVNSAGTDLEWAISSSGTSSGSTSTIQLSNGGGGFTAATNVLGGNTFISIGASTPATTGYLRFAYSTSDVILATKDSSNVNREIISRTSIADQYRFGPATSSAASLLFNGSNIDIKPSTEFSVTAPLGSSASLTVSGTGRVEASPNGFSGLVMDINGSANGANMQLFSAVTLAAGVKDTIAIGSTSSAPSVAPVGGGYLYVEAGALKYRGTSNTVTTVGPADPHCKKCGRDFMHEWNNDSYGSLSTCIPCLLDALEVLGVDVNSFSDRQLKS